MVVVERHHEVLTAWAEYRRQLQSPPRLLTLDHHTDTSLPFRNTLNKLYGPNSAKILEMRQKWLSEIDFRVPKTVELAKDRLNNDEHVVTSIKSGIISSALVVAHNAKDTDLSVYREHKIICRAVVRNPLTLNAARSDCDRALASGFLKGALVGFNGLLNEAGEASLESEPYIFDIDLDYFNTWLSVRPNHPQVFLDLAKGAGLVTIATEPAYVRSCALDPDLTSQGLLEELLRLLK